MLVGVQQFEFDAKADDVFNFIFETAKKHLYRVLTWDHRFTFYPHVTMGLSNTELHSINFQDVCVIISEKFQDKEDVKFIARFVSPIARIAVTQEKPGVSTAILYVEAEPQYTWLSYDETDSQNHRFDISNRQKLERKGGWKQVHHFEARDYPWPAQPNRRWVRFYTDSIVGWFWKSLITVWLNHRDKDDTTLPKAFSQIFQAFCKIEPAATDASRQIRPTSPPPDTTEAIEYKSISGKFLKKERAEIYLEWQKGKKTGISFADWSEQRYGSDENGDLKVKQGTLNRWKEDAKELFPQQFSELVEK